MKFRCVQCRRPLRATQAVLGKTVRCPKCGKRMRLPVFVPEGLRRFVYRSVN